MPCAKLAPAGVGISVRFLTDAASFRQPASFFFTSERYRASVDFATWHFSEMHTAINHPQADTSRAYPQSRHVLNYGHEAILLASRQRILELAGFRVEVANAEGEFVQHITYGCAGVIVLCQTLLPDEGKQAASLALETCPTVPLLVLYNQRLKFIPVQRHEFLQSNSGPRAFTELVLELMFQGVRVPQQGPN